MPSRASPRRSRPLQWSRSRPTSMRTAMLRVGLRAGAAASATRGNRARGESHAVAGHLRLPARPRHRRSHIEGGGGAQGRRCDHRPRRERHEAARLSCRLGAPRHGAADRDRSSRADRGAGGRDRPRRHRRLRHGRTHFRLRGDARPGDHAGDRRGALHRDPDRHRRLPLLEHLAALSRDRGDAAGAGRRSGGDVPAHLRVGARRGGCSCSATRCTRLGTIRCTGSPGSA